MDKFPLAVFGVGYDHFDSSLKELDLSKVVLETDGPYFPLEKVTIYPDFFHRTWQNPCPHFI